MRSRQGLLSSRRKRKRRKRPGKGFEKRKTANAERRLRVIVDTMSERERKRILDMTVREEAEKTRTQGTEVGSDRGLGRDRGHGQGHENISAIEAITIAQENEKWLLHRWHGLTAAALSGALVSTMQSSCIRSQLQKLQSLCESL